MTKAVNCTTRILEALGAKAKQIDPKKLKEINDYLVARRADTLSNIEFKKVIKEELAKELSWLAERERYHKIKNLADTERAVNSILQDIPGVPTWKRIQGWLTGGLIKVGDSMNIDVAHLKDHYSSRLTKLWATSVENLSELTRDKAIMKDVYESLDSIQKKQNKPSHIDNNTWKIAQAINNVQEELWSIKRSFDPFLRKVDNFIVSRVHNRAKIEAAGPEVWTRSVMEKFGRDSLSHLSEAQKIKYIRGVYSRIVDGSYGTPLDRPASATDIGTQFNIVNRFSKTRTFIANDWKADFDYNDMFGFETVDEMIGQLIRKQSRNLALLEKFGQNPTNKINKVIQDVKTRASVEEAKLIDKNMEKIKAAARTALGASDSPANNQFSRWVLGLMKLNSALSLGSATLRAFPDFAHAAGRLSTINGKSVPQNALSLVSDYVKFFPRPKARNEALNNLSLMTRSAVASIMRDISNSDLIDSTGGSKALKYINSTADLLSPLNMLHMHTDAMRASIGTVISRDLARMTDVDFNAMPKRFQRGMLRFGIKEAEWNVYKNAVETWDETITGKLPGGNKFLNADGIENVSDDIIVDYLKKTGQIKERASKTLIDRTRYELASKIGSLINHHADFGTATPGTAQKAFMYAGKDVNDTSLFGGLHRRMAFQFKSAVLTSFDSYRMIYESGDGLKGNLSGVAQTFATAFFLWSVGEYAVQLSRGRSPEDPTSPSFILRGILGSGAGGYFLDSFLNSAERNNVQAMTGETAKNLFLGPIPTAGLELASIGVQALKSPFDDEARWEFDAVKWFTRRSPNLFYLNGALNYYFLNGIKEYVSPGYLRR